MRWGLYIIWDKKTECTTGPVITTRHEAEATRAFAEVASDPQTQIGKYPEDYQLLRIGTLDDATPEIAGEVAATIMTGLDVRRHLQEEAARRESLAGQLNLLKDASNA